MRKLKDRRIVLKPDKGQGIVLINRSNYFDSLEQLSSDKLTFEVVNDDLTSRKFSTVQNYLDLLFSQREINKEQKNERLPDWKGTWASKYTRRF